VSPLGRRAGFEGSLKKVKGGIETGETEVEMKRPMVTKRGENRAWKTNSDSGGSRRKWGRLRKRVADETPIDRIN